MLFSVCTLTVWRFVYENIRGFSFVNVNLVLGLGLVSKLMNIHSES